MSMISRRSFLARSAAVSAAGGLAAVPVALTAAAAPEVIEAGDTRCMRLARELFDAMKAHYGDGCRMISNEERGSLSFFMPPPPPRIVEYAGAGWYEVENRGPELPTSTMYVDVENRFPTTAKDGRWFVATTYEGGLSDRSFYQESYLRTILIHKIGGAA